ncbi:MAG TPA: glyceraldehyde 3-phosphate dehydrogenase NAD-binding domain-containing protein [Thermoanaerobaculia bacterium]|nr:glyceraldehyde 3-phosphate dehydrogenase NAD-binding domain-containing protein [Thermoanaerobaculia bacterium]
MTTRFAINGLGRVGRALVRVAPRYPGLELVAVNDPATPEQVAHLLRYDTVHGRAEEEIGWEAGALRLGGRRVPLSNAATPEAIDWGGTAPAIVVEATGRFRQRALAAGHLRGGVERVIVSAILPDADATFCIGINEETFDPARHRVISNASCTTNCLAPLLRVLDRAFGVERALMNTVHCMTNSQQLVDMAHPDPRRARAAPANIIPTTSDAIPSIGWVMPEMAGPVEGLAMRVPIVAGSLVDLTVLLARDASREAVADAFRAAATGELAAILGVTDEELVSADFVGEPRSAVVDLPLLQQAGARLFRVVAWYDNEYGYAHRLAELVLHVGARSR